MNFKENSKNKFPANNSAENSNEHFKVELEKWKEKRFMYQHFIDGLISGNFKPLADSEIKKIIEQEYFSFEPLIELKPKQEELLKKYLFDHLKYVINRKEFNLLCQKIHSTEFYPGDTMLLLDENVRKKAENRGQKIEPFTNKDKLRFFNPNFWLSARYQSDNIEASLTYYGNRKLKEYGFSPDQWQETLKRVRAQTNKEKLAILDIGCGMGMALEEMKIYDNNIETHGLTIEQEPAMFEADQFHYHSAERMPASFKNKFDIILSNMSFRYYLFPNIALKNVILSLSKGGYVKISFGYDRMPDNEPYASYFKKLEPETQSSHEAMKNIISKEFKILESLQERGKIQFSTSPEFYKWNYHQGGLYINKLADVEPEDFHS